MWQRYVRGALLLLSGLLAIFLVYILTTRVEPEQAATQSAPQSLARADAGIDRFTFTQTRSGAVQWQVEARRAQLVEAEQRAVLEGVQVTLYGPKGRELRLAGDEGTIDTARKNFMLVKRSGTIAIELDSGYTILTNHLAWTDERREVTTSDTVTITGNGLEVSGRGLVGKLDIEEFQILDDVHVAIVQ
jgi:lipopolysaccharide export system protein LptC